MSVDLSQFHQVFFEESYEGLDAMEHGLLGMDTENPDIEAINTIFRSAHSIKGGSGTFGFSQIADFTHGIETLLDEIRSGDRAIDTSLVDLFLQSVDCLRGLIQDLQAGAEPDLSHSNELKAKFEAILSGTPTEFVNQPIKTPADDKSDAIAKRPSSESGLNETDSGVGDSGGQSNGDGGGNSGWFIRFIPHETLLQSGNEPIRMFRQLDEFCDGNMVVKPFFDKLPALTSLNPELCYLYWELILNKPLAREDIDEVFEWVEDDAEIIIESIHIGDGQIIQEVSLDDSAPPPAETLQVEEASLEVENVELLVDESPVDSIATGVESDKPPEIKQDKAVENAAAKKPEPQTKVPAAANKSASTQQGSSQESSSIRVSIDKVDSLINMVGELVITQSMLGQLGQNFDISRVQRLQEGLAQLEHNTRELQESVMKIRMMPISFVFSRFPRLVRDVSRTLEKKIELVMQGENTELDKTVMEKIGDPMVHLIRNSIDHGIESPENRLQKGKPETGTINLNAYHQSGNIVIEIKDDGGGLNKDKIIKKAVENGLITDDQILTDEQVFDLIFQPGFSTADQVSDLSGRGVGMDVVRRNIAALNGTVEVESHKDVGTSFIIRLPLTLAILDGQLVSVGDQTYIFPLVSIVESIQLEGRELNNVGGYSDVLLLRDEYVPILALNEVFNLGMETKNLEESIIVVVETDGEKLGIVVDELMGQQQVVIKSLEENYKRIDGISGATILGDGTVALIIDISGLAKIAGVSVKHLESGATKAA